MKIYIASDHRGFELKNKLVNLLKNSFAVTDLGPSTFVDNDDFVEYAISVAENVAKDSGSRGVVICGSGAGVEITANKIKGARCSLGQSIEQVIKAREADDINILAVSSDFTDINLASQLIKVFLTTNFISNENHLRRVEKVNNLE